MTLNDILTEDRVAAGLTVASKKKALEELAELLAKGAPDLTSSEVFSSLINREKLGSTGLGHGVAIPHGRLAGVQNSVGACIRLQHPVDYDAHDGQPVDLLFGLLVPQAATEVHLKHLAAIAERFSDEDNCAAMRKADSAAAVHQLLTKDRPD